MQVYKGIKSSEDTVGSGVVGGMSYLLGQNLADLNMLDLKIEAHSTALPLKPQKQTIQTLISIYKLEKILYLSNLLLVLV